MDPDGEEPDPLLASPGWIAHIPDKIFIGDKNGISEKTTVALGFYGIRIATDGAIPSSRSNEHPTMSTSTQRDEPSLPTESHHTGSTHDLAARNAVAARMSRANEWVDSPSDEQCVCPARPAQAPGLSTGANACISVVSRWNRGSGRTSGTHRCSSAASSRMRRTRRRVKERQGGQS